MAALLIAVIASFWICVLGGKTPLASRWTIVRGRERSCSRALVIRWYFLSETIIGRGIREDAQLGGLGGERDNGIIYFDIDTISFFGGSGFIAGGGDGYLRYVAFTGRHFGGEEELIV